MHTWMSTSLVVAVMLLILTMLLEAYLATFITRQIIQPFGRFEKYTQRIAAGDFSPITPTRKYRDEFTNLAIAINRMLKELKEHGEQLIQSRRMAAIGTLTAGIAHELNNPLNNISITTEALLEEFDEWERDEKLKMLKDIHTRVERASGTVANLLDFTHRDEISFEPLTINSVLRSTVRLVENELAINNIKLDMDLKENLRGNEGMSYRLKRESPDLRKAGRPLIRQYCHR